MKCHSLWFFHSSHSHAIGQVLQCITLCPEVFTTYFLFLVIVQSKRAHTHTLKAHTHARLHGKSESVCSSNCFISPHVEVECRRCIIFKAKRSLKRFCTKNLENYKVVQLSPCRKTKFGIKISRIKITMNCWSQNLAQIHYQCLARFYHNFTF